MQTRAVARYQRLSAQKGRLVGRTIIGLSAEEASNMLQFMPKKAARLIYKVLSSAVANAEQQDMDVDDLVVKDVVISEGPTMKRIKPRAMGRANRILKRTSHITVVVAES